MPKLKTVRDPWERWKRLVPSKRKLQNGQSEPRRGKGTDHGRQRAAHQPGENREESGTVTMAINDRRYGKEIYMGVLRECLVGMAVVLSPIWACCAVGAVCWIIRYEIRSRRNARRLQSLIEDMTLGRGQDDFSGEADAVAHDVRRYGEEDPEDFDPEVVYR